MGAWDIDSFDNDTACDWVYNLEETNDLSLVKKTIDKANDETRDELDADTACCALAACEVVARLKGNWGKRDAYTETVDAWVSSHELQPERSLIGKANKAIERVLGDDSELRDLWMETEYYEEWKACVINLSDRVNS